MKDQETGIMEGAIVGEEGPNGPQPEPPQKEQTGPKKPKFLLFSKLISFLTTWRRPKVITFIILFLIIVLVYFALILLSKKSFAIPITTRIFEEYSPTPTPSINPEIEAAKEKVELYKKDISTYTLEDTDLAIPNADLNIKF